MDRRVLGGRGDSAARIDDDLHAVALRDCRERGVLDTDPGGDAGDPPIGSTLSRRQCSMLS